MFIHRRLGAGPLQGLARINHRFGKRCCFSRCHAFKKNGHRKSGHLIVGDFFGGEALNQFINLFIGQLHAVPFVANQFCGVHVILGVISGRRASVPLANRKL